jgi:hypothetical protein
VTMQYLMCTDCVQPTTAAGGWASTSGSLVYVVRACGSASCVHDASGRYVVCHIALGVNS